MDGARIKALRESMDMTQAALARKLGVTVTSVYRWETGRSAPYPIFRKRLERMEKKATDAVKSATVG